MEFHSEYSEGNMLHLVPDLFSDFQVNGHLLPIAGRLGQFGLKSSPHLHRNLLSQSVRSILHKTERIALENECTETSHTSFVRDLVRPVKTKETGLLQGRNFFDLLAACA